MSSHENRVGFQGFRNDYSQLHNRSRELKYRRYFDYQYRKYQMKFCDFFYKLFGPGYWSGSSCGWREVHLRLDNQNHVDKLLDVQVRCRDVERLWWWYCVTWFHFQERLHVRTDFRSPIEDDSRVYRVFVGFSERIFSRSLY